jgi:sterol desaturase/sphingolipid hydroxylase (fatty acid hydroxylase superfamily)
MADCLVSYEPWIRLSAFAGIFVFMALWEVAAPRRRRPVPRTARWPSNLALVALNTLLMRWVLPTSAVGVALAVEAQGVGVIHWLGVPPAAAFALALVLLDLAIYLQHRLFHAVPLLWRLHRMHHADVDVDATNGLRFHPVEIFLSMLIKFAVITLVGAPAAAVVVFEVLLSSLAIFNHSNVAISEAWDKRLRWLVVTPDMHRIHHSWHADEHNRNYGFNLSGWDRLFGTYLAQPRDGQATMTLGLPAWRDSKWLRLDHMLCQPFASDPPDRK